MNNLVTIIIPTYNRAKFLQNISIPSVINQKYQNWELLIIDDGSIDETKEACNKFVEIDKRIKYFYKLNGGQGSARNLGIKKAQGDFILFLDDDDYLLSEMIEKILNEFSLGDFDIIGCRRWVFNYYKKVFDVNCSNPSCIIYKKYLFYKFSFFSEEKELIGIEDVDLSIKWDILRKKNNLNIKEKYIKEPLVIYLEHINQATSHKDLNKLRLKTNSLLSKYNDNIFFDKNSKSIKLKELGNFNLLIGDVIEGRKNLISSSKKKINFQSLMLLIISFGGLRFYRFSVYLLKLVRVSVFWKIKLIINIIIYYKIYCEVFFITKKYGNY